jgi:hypothetical protein
MPMLTPETTRHLIRRCESALQQEPSTLSEDDVRTLRNALGALHRGRVRGFHLTPLRKLLPREARTNH